MTDENEVVDDTEPKGVPHKVLKPCVVPQPDGSAKTYRSYGAVVDVFTDADSDRLVRDGFLEKIRGPEDEPDAQGDSDGDGILDTRVPPKSDEKPETKVLIEQQKTKRPGQNTVIPPGVPASAPVDDKTGETPSK